jgi:citrate synthase
MSTFKEGLQDIVAATSSICFIDGDKGILSYRGIDIHDLAEKSNFEEVCYLLWFGKLPRQSELDQLIGDLAKNRAVPQEVFALMKSFPKDANPMDVMRTAGQATPKQISAKHTGSQDRSLALSLRPSGFVADRTWCHRMRPLSMQPTSFTC